MNNNMNYLSNTSISSQRPVNFSETQQKGRKPVPPPPSLPPLPNSSFKATLQKKTDTNVAKTYHTALANLLQVTVYKGSFSKIIGILASWVGKATYINGLGYVNKRS